MPIEGEISKTNNLAGTARDDVIIINTAGAQIFTAAGTPSPSLGVNGDIYINTTNGDYYRKTAGAWGSPVGNLKGPPGPSGGGANIIRHMVTSGEITAKGFQLSPVPVDSSKVILTIIGGIMQDNGPDFSVNMSGFLSWSGLNLETLPISSGDILIIQY